MKIEPDAAHELIDSLGADMLMVSRELEKLELYVGEKKQITLGDVETMARYAIELLRDEKKMREMGKQARTVAMERFSSAKIVKQYEDYYRRVLERSA